MKMLKYLKYNCLTFLVIAAGIVCMAPSINQSQPVEDLDCIDLNMDIINNNNGTTYDYGDMNIDDILSDVAEKIILHNTDYSTNTKEEVFAEWGFGVRGPPSGEVSSGWDSNLNSDTLEIRNIGGIPGMDYDEWKSTNEDPLTDTMALTISIPKSQLDYDHDGIFSNEYEGISLTDVVKTDAFTATMPSGTPLFSDMKAYAANIPEPKIFLIFNFGFLIWYSAKRVSGE